MADRGEFRLRHAGGGKLRLVCNHMSNSEQKLFFIVGGPKAAATVNLIRRKYGLSLIVVVGESGDTDEIAQALAAGANCYLRETINSDLLQKTLELLTQEEVIFFPQLTPQSPSLGCDADRASSHSRNGAAEAAPATMVTNGNGASSNFVQNNNPWPPGTKLSAQETMILRGLVDGYSNKAIAIQLNITEATVKVHVKAILRKIPAKNRTQAAIWAVKNMPEHV